MLGYIIEMIIKYRPKLVCREVPAYRHYRVHILTEYVHDFGTFDGMHVNPIKGKMNIYNYFEFSKSFSITAPFF